MKAECYTDDDCIAALTEGDKGAFEVIYRRYVSELYRFARGNISSKEDCEEIIQEVFQSLWERHESLRIQTSLKAYLLGMVRYKIIHYFRKGEQRKRYTAHFQLFEAVYDQMEGDEVDHNEIRSTLDRLIVQLPGRCREAIELRLAEDLSNPDIAKRMNITTRTVEAYMFQAFNHIRASYKRYAENM